MNVVPLGICAVIIVTGWTEEMLYLPNLNHRDSLSVVLYIRETV
jgi:hypothetical protein